MDSQSESWDFIVVGSGPAGSALAHTLSQAPSAPRILLLEAGVKRDEKNLRVDGQRWLTFQQPSLNYGYKTIQQEHCNGREIDYSRGKVLGGSSAINFGCYTVGTRDDYDTWAELVDDETFSWKGVQQRFKALEDFDPTIVDERHRHFADIDPANHGREGKLKLGFAREWEEDLPLVMEAFKSAGIKWNGDHNSGDPIGVSLSINSVYKGVRSTAADLLEGAPANLEIRTASSVRRVVFEGKRAVGVEVDGAVYRAKKEIILSTGSLDTPRILMHSGLGPAAHLAEFNLPVLVDIPAIGQGLRDHPFSPIAFLREPRTNTRNAFFGSQEAMDAALTQWEKNNSGPWTRYGAQLMMGFLESEATTASEEYKALPEDVKRFLSKPTTPHFEVIAGCPLHMLAPGMTTDYSYTAVLVFLMIAQSYGEVKLQSSDPDVPLLFNPNLLAHEYDRRVVIEAMQEALAITKHEAFAKDTLSTFMAPASESDEICSSGLRIRMGKVGDKDAAVDNGFRVFGVEGLRVADMSVVPVLTNNHTQATAYVVGATAAEVLIKEYGL
ncbi:hypothetical protein BDV29DRAFT_199790 [Aspergillus leporis]|uniref:Glucose-methanol-choline oxidoreductase N-terminal domain-containing protein n=1 Tax=Aspergillus leporis TaxID=41062 RepID=A0A5N5WHF1_9EURO|nr:hypothetical protein BDV29DRAFT_199790 [Aspergillus leporis]